jgi:hypothetical protein
VLAVNGEMQFRLGIHRTYFVDLSAPPTVNYRNFISGGNNVIGVLREPACSQTGRSVSPDERWLLYGKHQLAGSQLMLIENFH